MEAKRRLLGIGCVGLGVLMMFAAAVWHFGPLRLHAASEDRKQSASEEIAVAPAPPPVRTDIRSNRAVADAVPTPTSRSSQPAPPQPEAPVPVEAPNEQPSEHTRPTREGVLSDTNALRVESVTSPYLQTGQPTVSQTALLRASDAQPGGPETMLDGNYLLIEAHDVAQQAESIVDFSRIVELCQAGIQAGVGPEAVEFAHHLMSWAYNRRGEEHDRLGEANRALVDFNAAVKHDPSRWQSVHNRGVSLARAGRMTEAIADFSQTIQLQPRYAKAYSNRAAIREQQGKLHEALRDFQKATELDQTLATAHAGKGRTLQKLNRAQEALIALDEALRLDGENPAHLTARGDVYAGMGDYESALADYGKAIEVDPSFATAYRNGSWLLATCPDSRFRDDENAVIGAQKALELEFGERHLCLDTLAAAYANAGDFEMAKQFAQKAIEEAPRPVQAFYEARLQMYTQRRPYRTQPVQQAAFVEAVH